MGDKAVCPICQQQVLTRKTMDVQDVISGDLFSIQECPSCTVERTFPVPLDLQPHYDSDMGRMMVEAPNRIHTFLKGFLLGQELRRILKRIHPGTFVDVGCGVGDFACFLSGKGHPVIAVDAGEEAPRAVREQSSILYYQIDFNQYEISGLKSLGQSTVILRHVLEHIRDPRQFLKRLVSYGISYFYIVVPNADCMERHLLNRYWGFWDPPRHLWHFNHHSLRVLFEGLQMTVLQYGYDTIPNIVPSFYRFLRLKGVASHWYNFFSPKGFLSSLSSPLNLLLPRNVAWALVKVRSGGNSEF